MTVAVAVAMTWSWVRLALLLLLLLAKKQMAVLWLSHQPQTMLAQAQHTHTQPHTRTYSSVFVCVTVGRLPCAHAIVLPFAVGKSSNFSKPQNKKHISYYKSSDPRAKKICYNPLAASPRPHSPCSLLALRILDMHMCECVWAALYSYFEQATTW